MLEISGVTAWLQLLGWLYAGLALAALGAALYWPKAWWMKAVLGSAVLAAMVGYPASKMQQAKQRVDDKAAIYQAKLARAKALFDERCKTAGEKIYRTVENVEGVLLMKVRPDKINFSDQYAMDDPYGRDVGGKGYIGSFLRSIAGMALNPRVSESRRARFSYVEVFDVDSKKLTRYTGIIKSVDGGDPNFELEAKEITNHVARYGVNYEDISTREERDNWIAGGLLTVIDIQTKETVAQRTGYIFDPGLGNISGGRGPWEAAIACTNTERKLGHNAQFVFKALKPSKGE